MINASQYVADAYTRYASHVNQFRSIPDSRDGLKIVQRRILQTLLKLGNHGSLIASASVVGDCVKYYHPHSTDSIYGAVVNMVNDPFPLLQGKGNFGGQSGLIETDAAAFRYTKVGLNKEGCRVGQLVKFSDFYENENEYSEASYIPMIYPYCLLSGSMGIGVGCVTAIPPIDISYLKRSIVDLSQGKSARNLELSPIGGHIKKDKQQIELFNKTGQATFIHESSLKWEWDKESGQNAVVITDVPSVVNLRKIEVVLKDEIEQGLIFVRNESGQSQKIVVARNKRIRRISDQELWNRIEKVTSRRVKYVCTVSDKGITRILTPLQILETSLEYAIKANNRAISEELRLLQDDVLFEKVKSKLVEMISADTDRSIIQKKLSLNDDQYSKFSSKSISTMRKNKDLSKINNEISQLNKLSQNPSEAVCKRFGVIR